MKSKKTLVTAFAILAVVGSALAYKSNAFNNHRVFCPDPIAGTCTILQTQLYQSTNNGTTPVEPCGDGVDYSFTLSTTCPQSGALFPTSSN
jgi:hypothetical protein